jgi:hypothetical protein
MSSVLTPKSTRADAKQPSERRAVRRNEGVRDVHGLRHPTTYERQRRTPGKKIEERRERASGREDASIRIDEMPAFRLAIGCRAGEKPGGLFALERDWLHSAAPIPAQDERDRPRAKPASGVIDQPGATR